MVVLRRPDVMFGFTLQVIFVPVVAAVVVVPRFVSAVPKLVRPSLLPSPVLRRVGVVLVVVFVLLVVGSSVVPVVWILRLLEALGTGGRGGGRWVF